MYRLIAIFVIAEVSATTVVDAQELPPPSILVSRQLAELEGLGIGDEVRLATDADGTNARAFVVAGIYEPTPNPLRLGNAALEARLHLPHLLDLTRPPDTPAGAEYVEAINVALVDPEALLTDRRRVDRVLQPALAAFLAHALGRLVEPAEDARREQA